MNSVQLAFHTNGLYIKDFQIPLDEVFLAFDNQGDVIAHDLLEHLEGIQQIGDPINELKALGAVWYIRGEHENKDMFQEFSLHQSYDFFLYRIAANIYNIYKILSLKDRLTVARNIDHHQFENLYTLMKTHYFNHDFNETINIVLQGYESAKEKYPNRDKINNFFNKMTKLLNDFIRNRDNIDKTCSWILSYGYEQDYVEILKN